MPAPPSAVSYTAFTDRGIRRRIISAKVFVGNLNFTTTQDQLKQLMSTVGTVVDIFLPNDRVTGRPRGFAFVEFSSEDEASTAIAKLNGQDLEGRPLRINEAEDRPRARPGGPRPGGPRPAPQFFDGPDSGGFGGGFGGGGGNHGGPPGKGGGGKNKGSRRGLRGRKRML